MSTFTGWLGPFTGEGIEPLAGGSAVTPIALDNSVDAITSSQVRVMGVTQPRRIQYAGSFGFSYNENDANGNPQDFVCYEHIINWEYMDLTIDDFLGNGNTADSIWYRLRPGVSMYIAAWYV